MHTLLYYERFESWKDLVAHYIMCTYMYIMCVQYIVHIHVRAHHGNVHHLHVQQCCLPTNVTTNKTSQLSRFFYGIPGPPDISFRSSPHSLHHSLILHSSLTQPLLTLHVLDHITATTTTTTAGSATALPCSTVGERGAPLSE